MSHKEHSKELIEKMVENYHHQVSIVGETVLSLSDYLRIIGESGKNIQYANEYNKKRNKE